jgi:hypothetical protein
LQVILQIIAGLSGISVVLSLLFLARQTSELARQTKLNNRIGTLGGMSDALERLHSVQGIFTDKPGLRPYFYEGKQYPRYGRRQGELLNIAEMIADAIDYGLIVVDLMPGTAEHEGWRNYAIFMVESSPVLRSVLNHHLDWFPAYKRLITEKDLFSQLDP